MRRSFLKDLRLGVEVFSHLDALHGRNAGRVANPRVSLAASTVRAFGTHRVAAVAKNERVMVLTR